jgi:hypothetical protein
MDNFFGEIRAGIVRHGAGEPKVNWFLEVQQKRALRLREICRLLTSELQVNRVPTDLTLSVVNAGVSYTGWSLSRTTNMSDTFGTLLVPDARMIDYFTRKSMRSEDDPSAPDHRPRKRNVLDVDPPEVFRPDEANFRETDIKEKMLAEFIVHSADVINPERFVGIEIIPPSP